MYVKKFTSFCQVLKKIHTKENRFLFSATVYIYSNPPETVMENYHAAYQKYLKVLSD